MSLDLIRKTPEQIIHELRVYQIELEIQNEELKKAHQDLEDSRDRYIDLYDFAPVGYFSLTKEGVISEVNLTGAAMLQSDTKSLIGNRFMKYIAGRDQDLWWTDFFIPLLKHIPRQTSEVRIIRKDGTDFPARIEGNREVKTDDPILVRIVVSDVTDRKQNELLRASEERLLMAEEIGQTGCWEYNLKTDNIWISEGGLRMYGFPPGAGDIDIEQIEACIPERARVHQALVDLITLDHEYNLECEIYPVDGSSPKIIHTLARLEKDADGSPIRVMGVIHEITDRKREEEHQELTLKIALYILF